MVATSSCAVADGGHNRRAPVAQRIVIQRVVIQRVVIQRFTESSPGTLIGYRPCFFLCSRAKVTPRFSAAARSVSGVTICTGLPDTVQPLRQLLGRTGDESALLEYRHPF